MAEFNSAENLNMNLAENLSTDVMTGGLDERMFLYFRLSGSMKKADGVDIIVSFLMESGVKMILKDLDQACRGARRFGFLREIISALRSRLLCI